MAYPCVGCGLNCNSWCIGCDGCDRWFHYACENLNKKQFNVLQRSGCDYFCTQCTNKTDGSFDFVKSLKRLESYVKAGNLATGAEVETIFLRKEYNGPVDGRDNLYKQINIEVFIFYVR